MSGLSEDLLKIGKDAVSGLLQGIESEDYLSKISSFSNQIIKMFQNILSPEAFSAVGNSAIAAFQNVFSPEKWSNIFSGAQAAFAGALDKIKQIWAAVPEWLNTAVANNDQIVTGIAYGVSTANEPVVNAINELSGLITALTQVVAEKELHIGDKDIVRAASRGQSKIGYSF